MYIENIQNHLLQYYVGIRTRVIVINASPPYLERSEVRMYVRGWDYIKSKKKYYVGINACFISFDMKIGTLWTRKVQNFLWASLFEGVS